MKDDSGRLALFWGPLLLVAVLVAVFRFAETGGGGSASPGSRDAASDAAPAGHPPVGATAALGAGRRASGSRRCVRPVPRISGRSPRGRPAVVPRVSAVPRIAGVPAMGGVPVGAAVPPAGRPFGPLLGARSGGMGSPDRRVRPGHADRPLLVGGGGGRRGEDRPVGASRRARPEAGAPACGRARKRPVGPGPSQTFRARRAASPV